MRHYGGPPPDLESVRSSARVERNGHRYGVLYASDRVPGQDYGKEAGA